MSCGLVVYRLMRDVAVDDPRVTMKPLDPIPLPVAIENEGDRSERLDRSEASSDAVVDRHPVTDV